MEQLEFLDDKHKTLSTLQVFQLVSRKCKSLLFPSCPKQFIRFLCECIVNLLKRNLQSLKRLRDRIPKPSSIALSEGITWKQRGDDVPSEKGLQLMKVKTLPSLTICVDMEQSALVPASVFNKSSNTQAVTKRELPKYQAEQNPTYQIDSLKKEINKKLFAKQTL